MTAATPLLLRAAWREWRTVDAPVIGYLFKVLLACLLALWLSLRFELEQPRTAMLTVAIVMQPRAGMVFAKSYYRLLGTLVGVLISFVLVALFAQERVLFLLCMAVWIGLCTAGSVIYRNHQSYAFVLAGYTLCIVGLPATVTPELTFDIGVTRISEILIGLLCATAVSDLVFPQRMWDVMLAAVRRRFKDFSDLLRAPVSGRGAQPALLRFFGDIYSLESFRASTILENDESRRQRLRLSLMDHEFMQASTSLHALEQLLRRCQPQVGEALLALCRQLGETLTLDGRSARNEQEASLIVSRLAALRGGIVQKVTVSRRALPQNLDAEARLDFDTGVELLQRLVQELHAYAMTYAALAHGAPESRASTTLPRAEVHFDPVGVVLAGVRGALTLGIMTAVWIFTDWRSGIEAITIGVVTSTIFATAPSPQRVIRQFMIGAIIGTVLAFICNFYWLTQAQGFWMLALAVAPPILLAAWLTTRPTVAVVGSGLFIVFLLHSGFNGTYSANPVVFANDAIADLLAVLLSGIMYGLIDISSSGWSRRRIITALRRLVVAACREPLALRRARLEAAARDLVQRAGSAQRLAEEQDRAVIDWLLHTLEIGHAVIALREQLAALDRPLLAEPVRQGLEAVAELHVRPSAARRTAAVAALDLALAGLDQDAARLGLAQAARHEMRTMLHFIRSALLDEASILAFTETA